MRILTLFLGALVTASVAAQPLDWAKEVPVVAQLEGADNPESALGLAESFFQKGQFGEAERLALHVLRDSPQSQGARFLLANIALSTGRIDLGQKYVSELLTSNPKEPDNLVLQGMVFMLRGEPVQAIDYLKQGVVLGQDQCSAGQLASYVNTLALAYHQNDQPELALETCLEGVDKYPRDPDLFLTGSRLYREAGDYQSALEIAQKGLSLHPDFSALYASVALAQAGLGHSDLAEQAYSELKARDPNLAADLKATLDGARDDSAELKVRRR